MPQTNKKKKIIKKLKRYLVNMDVFFMESHEVEAENKKIAFELAREQVNHGMGEEVTLFEITKLNN